MEARVSLPSRPRDAQPLAHLQGSRLLRELLSWAHKCPQGHAHWGESSCSPKGGSEQDVLAPPPAGGPGRGAGDMVAKGP